VSLLEIAHLSVGYGAQAAITDVSLSVDAGEIVALLGPSGSGKSTLALAAIGLLPGGAVRSGAVRVDGHDLVTIGGAAVRRLRGRVVAMIFQEPATALNPALTIGRQIGEVLTLHRGLRGRARDAAVRALLARVGLELAPARYPHSLSGGQRQRVAIAMALAGGPKLLLADEPTAALDPAARGEIAALLRRLAREEGIALLLVTHDRAFAAAIADRVLTLEQGRLTAVPPAAPSLPPRVSAPRGETLLAFDHVGRTYGSVVALDDVSLELARGETLAIIGRSGSGKSTLARLALGLEAPDRGAVRLAGEDWRRARGRGLRAHRRRAQAVLQDPATSFDPRQTVGRIIAEPLHLLDAAADRARLVGEALSAVGLPPDAADRLPQAFSGGQRQRIALARALILRPDLIVLDEALSALDDRLQADMVALLTRLQAERGLAYLFIAHDLALVDAMADRVLELRQGRVVAG
jgi:peptide/nickel transport system ATP-binding protein